MSHGQTTSYDAKSNGTKPQRPKRRWLQYSLRGLLVLTLLAAVGAWWIKRERDTARRQEQAIEELSKLGEGRFAVAYNYQFDADGKHDEFAGPPDDHPWLRAMLGDAYFDKPEWLAINGVEVTKANSRWLRDLLSLKRVSISVYPKSERGSFAVLGQLTELRELELQCDAVSDEDLLAWGNLPNLEIVVAATQGSTISSEALHATLHNKPKLRSLGLWQVNFGPGAFGDWESLPELANLDLPNCTFADQDFSGLEGKILQEIELRGSNIADEALIHIGKLPVLNNLSACSIWPRCRGCKRSF